jgi:hypothetical protein
MDWQSENRLAELVHAMKLLCVRYVSGEMSQVDHRRQLEDLLDECRQLDAMGGAYTAR